MGKIILILLLFAFNLGFSQNQNLIDDSECDTIVFDIQEVIINVHDTLLKKTIKINEQTQAFTFSDSISSNKNVVRDSCFIELYKYFNQVDTIRFIGERNQFSEDAYYKKIKLGSSFVAYNQKDSAKYDILKTDTIDVKLQKIVFITNDTTFNCFIVFDTLGIFYSIATKQRLDTYINQQEGVFIYTNNLITGRFIRVFKVIDEPVKVYSYRTSEVDYFDGENLKTDNLGIPILEYDVEHSYILQQMKQNTSGQYIYCLINDGTKRLYSFPPLAQRNSILLKVDPTQDTTYNFFMYRAQSKSYQGMQLVAQDSTILPLKKLRKSRIYNYMGVLLTSKEDSDIYSENYERTYALIVTGKRFVVSPNLYRKRDDEWGWVSMVESISITLKQLQEKLFQ